MGTHQDLPLATLTAISPLDGRYRDKVASLALYFSELNLIRIRIEIECAYLVALSKQKVIRSLTLDERRFLKSLGSQTKIDDAEAIKRIEGEIKHDMKAVEVYLRKKLTATSLKDIIEMIHFGLTSEDINNIAYRLMLKRATESIMIPSLEKLLGRLLRLAKEGKTTPMLARTHGQPAVPTTLGKELVIFATRLNDEVAKFKKHVFSGKLAGAVGNYNALVISFEKIDWISFARSFVSTFGFNHTIATAQTNTYEDIIEYFQMIQRINSILIDLNQDMWRYISDGWFVQEVKRQEVSSSTMPQKINPILFENSEGNLGIANAMIEFFVRKLPISRLQRDLSDSTVIRNFGSCLGYSLLAYQSTLDGLSRVKPNYQQLEKDLLADWSILAEAAQTILRKNGVKDPYSLLKHSTRGEQISEERWKEIVSKLPIKNHLKQVLLSLSPKKYIGLAPEIVEQAFAKINLETFNKGSDNAPNH